jgi:hypothetical protein
MEHIKFDRLDVLMVDGKNWDGAILVYYSV